MSIFNAILQKLGIEKSAAPAAPAKPAEAPGSAKFQVPDQYKTPAPIKVVDVVSKLDQLAKANPEKLNWKESIVDLLKLLGLKSSNDTLAELATELNCPPSELSSSFKRNMWLHKTVLQKIADNGGNIPAQLLQKK
jgi:hypothetical protein